VQPDSKNPNEHTHLVIPTRSDASKWTKRCIHTSKIPEFAVEIVSSAN